MKNRENEIRNLNKSQYFLFNISNIFYLLTSKIEKIVKCPVFEPDFYIFSLMNNSGEFK